MLDMTESIIDLDVLLAKVREARAVLALASAERQLAEAAAHAVPIVPTIEQPAPTPEPAPSQPAPEDDYSDLLEEEPAPRRTWTPLPARHGEIWTREEHAVLEDMSLSVWQKATRLGRTIRAVEMRMENYGLYSPVSDGYETYRPTPPPEGFVDLLADIEAPPEKKNPHVRSGTPWTSQEDALAMDRALPLRQIATTLGRTESSVNNRRVRIMKQAMGLDPKEPMGGVPPRWSPQEDEILEKARTTINGPTMQWARHAHESLPHRSVAAIVIRAHRLDRIKRMTVH